MFKALFGLLIVFGFGISPTYALDRHAKIESGIIVGNGGDVTTFKGIPYAAPPVGKLRWREPEPVNPWLVEREATHYGAICPQPKELAVLLGIGLLPQSEDCLTLNVFTAARTAREKRPVMVWIHGGGFAGGSSSMPGTDGEALARKGVVVVSLNYRLGPFGFMAHPELSDESPHCVSGNYGLLDQVAALQWVQRNISAFGGDPEQVTVWGESAGAVSVSTLLVSPLAQRLFQRAIVESGIVYYPIQHLTQSWYGDASAEQNGLNDFGSDLQKLRSESTEEIMKQANISLALFFGDGAGLYRKGTRYLPVVDGWAVPDEPSLMLDQGLQNDVAVMAGTNADEGSIFTIGIPIQTVSQYQAFARKTYGDSAESFLKLYPVKQNFDVRLQLMRSLGDGVFLTSMHSLVRQVALNNQNSYLYRFSKLSPISFETALGAFHGSEIPYVFGNVTPTLAGYDLMDWKLSEAMSSAWVRFAMTGDPNGDEMPYWPRYEEGSDAYVDFDFATTAKSALHAREVEFFLNWFEKLREADISKRGH